jgi:hypothetical protein
MKVRLLRRRKKVDEVSDACIEDFKKLGQRYEAPCEIVVIDSERHIEETVSNALAGLVNIHLMKA